MGNIFRNHILKVNASLWGGWLALCFATLVMQDPQSGEYGVMAVVSGLLVLPQAVLGVLWWPLCRLLSWKKLPKMAFAAAHFLLANIFTALWLALSFASIRIVFSSMPLPRIDIYGVAVWLYPMGILLYAILTGSYYWLINRHQLQETAAHSASSKKPPSPTAMNILKSPINLQFIIDILDDTHDAIPATPGRAREMLRGLKILLKNIITYKSGETTTLEAELAFVHQYVELEKIRLQDRLVYEEVVDPGLYNYAIPVMMLQPLLENAIEHGIQSSQTGGWIRLNINREQDSIIGVVENSIERLSPREKREAVQKESSGLKQLQQRLALIYGKEVQFTARPVTDENLFRVQFNLPVKNLSE